MRSATMFAPRVQFRVSTLLLVVLAVALVISLWPKPRSEVDLGFYDAQLPSGRGVRCGISVVTRSPVFVGRTLEGRSDQLRREVAVACRSVSPHALEDPALIALKSELIARIERVVGAAQVESLIIHHFELRMPGIE